MAALNRDALKIAYEQVCKAMSNTYAEMGIFDRLRSKEDERLCKDIKELTQDAIAALKKFRYFKNLKNFIVTTTETNAYSITHEISTHVLFYTDVDFLEAYSSQLGCS